MKPKQRRVAIVGPGGYKTVCAACKSEPAGTLILIRGETHEPGTIKLKRGQTLA